MTLLPLGITDVCIQLLASKLTIYTSVCSGDVFTKTEWVSFNLLEKKTL